MVVEGQKMGHSKSAENFGTRSLGTAKDAKAPKIPVSHEMAGGMKL